MAGARQTGNHRHQCRLITAKRKNGSASIGNGATKQGAKAARGARDHNRLSMKFSGHVLSPKPKFIMT
jgi:hypothetical protein